jgi:uncharacterized protein
VVSVADLLRRAGSSRLEVVDAPMEELQVIDTRMPGGSAVHVEVRLESLNEGAVAKGVVEAPWAGSCRRCLTPVTGTLRSEVLEVFEAQPTEGETLLLDGDRIDLEPVAREAVLLELPIAPLCREDCRGLCPTCGADRNEVDCDCDDVPADPRWGGLEGLTFDE